MEIKIWYEERKCGDFAYLIERREKVGGMNEERREEKALKRVWQLCDMI